jgi:tRNA (guanine37-N1)-methyltransferase
VRVDLVSIFPEAFAPLRLSVVGKAVERGRIEIHTHDLRAFTDDRHRTTDDEPYGGGPGMVLKAEPFLRAVDHIQQAAGGRGRIVIPSPQGRALTSAVARALAAEPRLIFLCGHYEGIDERVTLALGADEISIGDYVLTGGELAAMVIVDASARYVPGVVGDEASVAADSFTDGLLDHPHYTRPPVVAGLGVPPVLLSGHHGEIARWRRKETLRRTLRRRPDLISSADLSPADRRLLDEVAAEDGPEYTLSS